MTLAEFQPSVERAITALEWATARARWGRDVTADMVPQSPIRSVPIDLITAAVVRALLRLPAEFPVLSLKTAPTDDELQDALIGIAARWQHPMGSLPADN